MKNIRVDLVVCEIVNIIFLVYIHSQSIKKKTLLQKQNMSIYVCFIPK